MTGQKNFHDTLLSLQTLKSCKSSRWHPSCLVNLKLGSNAMVNLSPKIQYFRRTSKKTSGDSSTPACRRKTPFWWCLMDSRKTLQINEVFRYFYDIQKNSIVKKNEGRTCNNFLSTHKLKWFLERKMPQNLEAAPGPQMKWTVVWILYIPGCIYLLYIYQYDYIYIYI